MRSTATAVVFAVLLSFSLAAQEQKLAETIEVRVANIDVVVTDRAGNPVTGLTKSDFELFENGKPQTITNFYEVRGTAELAVSGTGASASAPVATAPDDIRARRFVLCIDNYSLQPNQRNAVIVAVRKFINTTLQPGDEASLIVWARKIDIVTPLTTDKAELNRGLDSIAARSRAAMSLAQEDEQTRQRCRDFMSTVPPSTWDDAWVQCQGTVNAFAESVWGNGKALLADLKAMVSNLAGIDGRKVFILAGASLPQHPGRETIMWAVDQFREHLPRLNPSRAFSEGASRSQTFSIASAAQFANANDVTFYAIDAADARDRAAAINATIPDYTEEFLSFADSAMAYKTLAEITGGTALTSTQNFDLAFQTLTRDLNSFYSLGYHPSEGDAMRKLVVKAKKEGLNVRARQTFTPKSSEQEMHDRIVANLFHRGAAGEWPVVITAQPPEKNGEMFKIPLTIEMDSKSVTLLPQEGKLLGGFVLYLIVGTKEGAMSKVSRTPRKIEIPTDAESELRGKPITLKLALNVKPGDNIVSIGIVDQVSAASGFARVDVAAR